MTRNCQKKGIQAADLRDNLSQFITCSCLNQMNSYRVDDEERPELDVALSTDLLSSGIRSDMSALARQSSRALVWYPTSPLRSNQLGAYGNDRESVVEASSSKQSIVWSTRSIHLTINNGFVASAGTLSPLVVPSLSVVALLPVARSVVAPWNLILPAHPSHYACLGILASAYERRLGHPSQEVRNPSCQVDQVHTY